MDSEQRSMYVCFDIIYRDLSKIVYFSIVLVTVSAGDDSFPVCVLSPVD